jgi:hypothetical protein
LMIERNLHFQLQPENFINLTANILRILFLRNIYNHLSSVVFVLFFFFYISVTNKTLFKKLRKANME